MAPYTHQQEIETPRTLNGLLVIQVDNPICDSCPNCEAVAALKLENEALKKQLRAAERELQLARNKRR